MGRENPSILRDPIVAHQRRTERSEGGTELSACTRDSPTTIVPLNAIRRESGYTGKQRPLVQGGAASCRGRHWSDVAAAPNGLLSAIARPDGGNHVHAMSLSQPPESVGSRQDRPWLAAFALLQFPCGRIRRSGSSAEQRAKTFEWFNTLGFPDVKDLKFVRVTTGETDYVGKTPQPRIVHGFLIHAANDHFKVFTDATEISDYKRAPATASDKPGVDYQADDLLKYAEATLKSLRNPEAERLPSGLFPEHDNSVSRATEGFVVSWACWRKGHDKLAAELFNQAAGWPRGSGSDLSETFQVRVAADLSAAEMRRAVGAAFPTSTFLATFCSLDLKDSSKRFQIRAEALQARQIATALKEMVREDKDHAALLAHRKPFGQLAKKDQIAELIFQLRDDCNTCGEARADARLEKFGYDAVPQLIAALDDKRLSRTAEYSRQQAYIDTVGDIAAEILSRISCRNFGGNLSPLSDPTHDESRLAAIKKEAEAWYAEANRKGEKRMLTEATEKGDDDCLASALRLRKNTRMPRLTRLQTASAMRRTAMSGESSSTAWR